MRRLLVLAAGMAYAGAAWGQALTFTGAEELFGPAPPGHPYGTIPGGAAVDSARTFIPVAVPGTNGGYLRVDSLLAAAQGADPRVPALQAQIDAANQFAFLARRDARRALEAGVLAAAITVMPPDPGKMLNVTVSGASTEGTSAAGLSASVRISDGVLAFGAIARSSRQTLAKGGVSFSPW